MRDLVFCSIFFFMAVFSLQTAFLPLILWIWSALWPVNDYVYSFGKSIPFNKIAVFCTITMIFWDKNKNISLDRTLVCMIALLISISISFVTSDTPPGWGEMYYENMIKIVFAAVIIRFVMVDRLKLHACMLAFGTAIGAGGADETLKFILSGGGHHVIGPPSWGDENSTATIMLMALPIMLYLFHYARQKTLRIVIVATMLLDVIGVIGTYSRGGFIGLTILVLILFRRSSRKLRSLVALSLVVLIGLAYLPDSWFDRIATTSHAEEDSSFMYRVVQWKILYLMALDKPWFGQGIIANLVPTTWQSYAVRLGGELTFINTPKPNIPQASHSIFFQMLGENGFVGLALYLLLYILTYRMAGSIRRDARDRPDLLWAADMATSLRLSLTIYLLTGAVLPIPYLEFPYLIIGCLSALRAVQQRLLTRTAEPDGFRWNREAALLKS